MNKRFATLWTAAILATAMAFLVHLTMRFETVRLGYEVGKARKEHARLLEMRRMLAIEAAMLHQASRIESLARQELHMDLPSPSHVVPMGKRAGLVTAGRVR